MRSGRVAGERVGIRNRSRAWLHISADPETLCRSISKLSAGDKLLLLAIADVCSDEHGVLTMGERKLAEKLGVSRAWVRSHRPSLVKAGLLYPRGTWKPGQAISWQLFPEIYGAEAPDFEPPAWEPSRSSKARDPAEIFGNAGRDPGPVHSRAAPRPAETKLGSGPREDRAGVVAIEPDEPLVRDEEKERDALEVSNADALLNLFDAFPGAEVVADA